MSRPDTTAVEFTSSESYVADSCEPVKLAVANGQIEITAAGRGAYPGVPLPDDALPELTSVGAWNVARAQDWGLDWHRNEGLELTFVAAGKLDFAVSTSSHVLRRGGVTITRPWQPHRVGGPNVTPSRLIWVILDLGVQRPNQPWVWPSWLLLDRDAQERLTRLLRGIERPVWDADAELVRAFERLPRSLAGGRANMSQLALGINEVLVALLDVMERERPILDSRLASSERTIELFLHDLPHRLAEPWTLETMSAACGIGRTRFAHYVHALTNLSPVAHLRLLRVEQAARLLAGNPALSVTDICFSCGFSSTQYFATVFRAERHVSPLEYRMATRAREARGA
ncbi:MAG: AraC family transcriptional regulator [Thermoleophilia bacterium]|nr:AraC family transcriptional regulator [Thermoleophilia bacterium]